MEQNVMTVDHEPATEPDWSPATPSIDADESGALAIGLMVAVIILVALMTIALVISIP